MPVGLVKKLVLHSVRILPHDELLVRILLRRFVLVLSPISRLKIVLLSLMPLRAPSIAVVLSMLVPMMMVLMLSSMRLALWSLLAVSMSVLSLLFCLSHR